MTTTEILEPEREAEALKCATPEKNKKQKTKQFAVPSKLYFMSRYLSGMSAYPYALSV